jgi:cell shape-determining protein MreC
MNNSGWGVACLLFILLIAVGIGVEQVRGGLLKEIQSLMKERGEVITLVEEATSQRNDVIAERDQLNKKMVELEEEKKAAALKLEEALKIADKQDDEIEALRDENARLQKVITKMETELANLPQEVRIIPVSSITPVPSPVVIAVPQPSVSSVVKEKTRMPLVGKNLKKQAVTAVAMFMGVVILSSGGITAYWLDPNRKISVKMTPEQYQDPSYIP